MTEGARDTVRKSSRLRWLIRAMAILGGLAAAIGLWWALGKPGLLWGAGFIAGAEKPAARFALPEPTGCYPVGTTEMRLVDRDRPDPWVEGEPRKLMVSVWYPARDVEDHALAPYMQPGAAARFELSSLGSVGLEPEQVDLEGARTHVFSQHVSQ